MPNIVVVFPEHQFRFVIEEKIISYVDQKVGVRLDKLLEKEQWVEEIGNLMGDREKMDVNLIVEYLQFHTILSVLEIVAHPERNNDTNRTYNTNNTNNIIRKKKLSKRQFGTELDASALQKRRKRAPKPQRALTN